MRDPKRIKVVCNELEKVWNEHPDLRLGQLLINYVFYVPPRADIRMWLQSDDATLERLLSVKVIREDDTSK